MTLRVLSVDDEPLARGRLDAMLAGLAGVVVAGEADSGPAALEQIALLRPDVVLLDVEMPRLDGFDVIEELARRGGEPPLIVFVTAHDCHAASAFDSGVVDFLTKPVRIGRLEVAIERVRRALDQREALARLRLANDQIEQLRGTMGRRPARELWIQRRGESVRVDLDRVERIAAESEYVRIFVDGTDYLHREPMTAMLARLDPQQFARVHRSHIVDRARVAAVRRSPTGSYRLVMQDGQELPTGRHYRQVVRDMAGASGPA